jgi:hypothetical protein
MECGWFVDDSHEVPDFAGINPSVLDCFAVFLYDIGI